MSFELIEAEEAHYPKALMCRALGLSRSGHHAYSTRGPSRRALEEQQLDVLVAAIFAELAGRYGAPRIQQELRRRGQAARMAELRNKFGTGHGKHPRSQALQPRHARLAVGASATLVTFLYDTHIARPP